MKGLRNGDRIRRIDDCYHKGTEIFKEYGACSFKGSSPITFCRTKCPGFIVTNKNPIDCGACGWCGGESGYKKVNTRRKSAANKSQNKRHAVNAATKRNEKKRVTAAVRKAQKIK